MNLVFDLGGVVFRWRPAVLLQQTLPEAAPDEASAQALAAQFFQAHSGDWSEFDRGTIEVNDLARRIAVRCGLSTRQVHRVIDAVPDELVPFPDSVALLQRLHAQGVALYYLSNMPLPYATYIEGHRFFNECFRDGVFSSRVHEVKPGAEIYRLAALRFRIEPAASVFLDDTQANVDAAGSLGWNALKFIDAADCEKKLQAAGWIGSRLA
jgi:putative hydrolase of the HAD superfamily